MTPPTETENNNTQKADNASDFEKKALDLNTESLKLYTTIALASSAGLITYHNSSNFIHNEPAFEIALCAFILCALMSILTLNSYINNVLNNQIAIRNKTSIWANKFAIALFLFGLLSAITYIAISPRKSDNVITQGAIKPFKIKLADDDLLIEEYTKEKIRITIKDSCNRREIIIIR
ncbi:hypothetical protein Q5H92_00870 [Hymenobacter sp. M29]|uniref:Uncharacterized protein n=1 Tax=Hymenobacter mellowenesis TaxID=3063995 RepID=A0ABT9A4X1_9BACT|nr:hypothetical protein [Hymenobacter sp. M29]MDO7844891.1 hypothetical protein [Hymenobacter sp. M29]